MSKRHERKVKKAMQKTSYKYYSAFCQIINKGSFLQRLKTAWFVLTKKL